MELQDKSKIAVLIPCYNEEKTIAKVVTDYKKALPNADIYVFDNNSTDKTVEIAKEHGAIVCTEPRQGKGNVVRTMFREIDADCYLLVDGDDTYPADNAQEMCDEVLHNHSDMVVGDRLSSTYFVENDRRFHNFGNVLVRSLINFIWRKNKVKIFDVMSGYRAFSKLFVKSFPIVSKGFEIETEMTIHALDKNLVVKNIPIDYRNRPEGSESKLNTYSDGFKVIFTIFNLFREFKPLSFFSVFAAILFIFGIGTFIPVLIDYIDTGLVPRFPTLIVSCISFILSLQCFFTGLILDTLTSKDRKNFELFILSNKFDK